MKIISRVVAIVVTAGAISWAQAGQDSQKVSYQLLARFFKSAGGIVEPNDLLGWISGRMILEASPQEPLAAMIVGRAAGNSQIKVFPLVLPAAPEDFYDDPVRAVYPAKDYIDLMQQNMSTVTLSSASAIFNYVEPDQSSKIFYELRRQYVDSAGPILILRFEARDSQGSVIRRGYGIFYLPLSIPQTLP